MKKVLVACPLSEYKHYIIPLWIEHLKKMKSVYPFDILLVDNSHNKTYSRFLKEYSGCIQIVHRPPHKNEKLLSQTMAACNNIILNHLSRNNYDYLFSLECDVFPPFDSLPRLLAANCNVISGIYNIGRGATKKAMIQVLEKNSVPELNVRNVTTREGFQLIDGTIKPIFGCGIGCTLINANLLKNYSFHVDQKFTIHADTHFYTDMYNAGVPVYLDTSIFCEHHNTANWSEINKRHEQKHY
ncbi:MAG: hypothetical protein K9H26_10795 [Prolixibacteraceae bacterium]|nr:hypothetical protein [Prolixibacteraceae bacterium]